MADIPMDVMKIIHTIISTNPRCFYDTHQVYHQFIVSHTHWYSFWESSATASWWPSMTVNDDGLDWSTCIAGFSVTICRNSDQKSRQFVKKANHTTDDDVTDTISHRVSTNLNVGHSSSNTGGKRDECHHVWLIGSAWFADA